MPDYVVLMKLTSQGAAKIAEAPARIQGAQAAWADLGGTVKSFHVTMGEYDYVAIGEAPNDWSAMAFVAELAAAGDVTTTTMKAFSADDWKWALNASAADIREGSVGGPVEMPMLRRK